MAMTNTIQHPKFKRLKRRLGIGTAHTLGLLECLWQYTHSTGNPVYCRDDIEAVAEWEGELGILLSALVVEGWVDQNDDGTFSVHDYWENCPGFVRERLKKQRQRMGHTGDSPGTRGGHTGDSPDKKGIEGNGKEENRNTDPISGAEFLRKHGMKPEPTTLDQIMALCGDGPEFRDWWARVVELHREPDRMADLMDDIARIRDTQNPATRQAKDLGAEFTSPNKWLAKQCKERLGKLPRFTKGTK